MALALKAAAIAVIGSLLALLLRRSVPEMALMISVTAGMTAAFFCVSIAGEIAEACAGFAEKSGISSVLLMPVIKCVGIALVTELAAQICRDASQGAAGAFVELCGTLCALYVALPLVRSLLGVVEVLI
ncbi:MAG: hypothetical protein IJE26_08075 [Oscillospiraceae bacterium]|nr:hypothetical protein [Oscillospiraceae bacterium]